MGCEPIEGLSGLGGAVVADLVLTSPPTAVVTGLGEGRVRQLRRSDKNAMAVQREDHGGGGVGRRYSRNAPHSELGEAVVERRLLTLAGWTVVSVPRHLWHLWVTSLYF